MYLKQKLMAIETLFIPIDRLSLRLVRFFIEEINVIFVRVNLYLHAQYVIRVNVVVFLSV